MIATSPSGPALAVAAEHQVDPAPQASSSTAASVSSSFSCPSSTQTGTILDLLSSQRVSVPDRWLCALKRGRLASHIDPGFHRLTPYH